MSTRSLVPLAASILIAAAVPGQIATCPGQGPLLSVTGGRLGDTWSIGLSGVPNAAALVAVDAAPGPVLTPFGPVCLGLTAALSTLPVTLDAAGNFTASGLLPIVAPGISGTSVYLQAAAAEPLLPYGFGLTNGWAVTFRPPLIGVFQGATQAIPGPPTAGRYVAIDPITDSIVVNTPHWIWNSSHATRVPRLGWFAFRAGNSVQCIDDFTGAITATLYGVLPGSQYGCGCEILKISTDGSLAFVTPTLLAPVPTVSVFSLPTGTLVATGAFPAIDRIVPVPGTSLAYVRDYNKFYVFDAATNSTIATVFLPSPSAVTATDDAVFIGNILYAQTNAGLVAIDTTTHAIVAGPVPLGHTSVRLVAAGPGFSGAALLAIGGTAAAGYAVVEHSPTTLAVTGTTALPAAPLSLTVSAGGTEWLLEVLPPGASLAALHVMNVVTGQYTPLVPSIVSPVFHSSTAVLRSNTLSKAYVLTSATTLLAFQTDPVGTTGPSIALPATTRHSSVRSN